MSEELLHGSDVVAALQKVGRERVPERVAVDHLGEPGRPGCLLHPNPAMKPERSPQMLMNTWFNSNAFSPDKGLGAFEPEAKNAPRVG